MSALQWVGENKEKPKDSAKAKCGWTVGYFWRNCKSNNRFGRPPYCHTGITIRWQHDVLLKNEILRDDWKKILKTRDFMQTQQEKVTAL